MLSPTMKPILRSRSTESTLLPALSRTTTEKMDPFEQNSALESQHKKADESTTRDEKPNPSSQNDRATNVGVPSEGFEKSYRPRKSTWWLLGALIIAIPLVVTALHAEYIGAIPATGLLIWLEILWTAAWILHACIRALSMVLTWICRLAWSYQLSLSRWEDFGNNTAWTHLWFMMSLVAWGSSSVICRSDNNICDADWLKILKKVLLATVPVSAIFLAEDVLMEILVTTHSLRTAKGRQLEKLAFYSAAMDYIHFGLEPGNPASFATRFANFWFPDETQPQVAKSTKNKSVISTVAKILRSIFMKKKPDPSMPWDDRLEAYHFYCSGKGNDEDFQRNGTTYPEHFRSSLLTGVGENQTFATENALKEQTSLSALEIKEIMNIMDKNGNGEITWGEFADCRMEIAVTLRNAMAGVHGIKRAARTANAVLCFLLFFVVAIIYGEIFQFPPHHS
jgi:hypothetical protein